MPLYRNDPNDSNKQLPSVNNRVLVKEAVAPAANVVTTRPDHVIINNSGSYAFLYSTTCSLGGTSTTEAYVTASVVKHFTSVGSFTPYKLDINPVAWKRTEDSTDSATGDITFVLKGKYKPDAGPK